jgi:hypothetical protein
MIDAIKLVLERIYRTIPRPVLEAAFKPWETGTTLDECIKNKVLLSSVRDEISIRGGKILKIMLNLNWCEYTSSPSPYALGVSGSYSTYRVPAEARENRDISCVLSVRFPYSINTSSSGNFYNTCTTKGNTVSSLACAALQSQTGANMLSTPTGIIRPGNVIQLDPPQYNWVPWQVTVRLVYDDNFSGMDVSSDLPFIDACIYAVQQYIYNELVFAVESNMVVHGMEIGVFRDIIGEFKGAEEKYNEALLALGGAEIYDPSRLKNILTRMVPRR